MNMFNTVEEVVEDLRNGKIVLVSDPEEREHEIDMISSCQSATPDVINFMATHAKGLICMPMSKEKADSLSLEMMTAYNTDVHHTAFTVSIDDKDAKTGISAFERSDTALKVARKDATRKDFRSPGHMFPLVARDGGVLEECGLCCEIMADDGSMMHLDGVGDLMKKFGLKLVSIDQIVEYRKKHNI